MQMDQIEDDVSKPGEELEFNLPATKLLPCPQFPSPLLFEFEKGVRISHSTVNANTRAASFHWIFVDLGKPPPCLPAFVSIPNCYPLFLGSRSETLFSKPVHSHSTSIFLFLSPTE